MKRALISLGGGTAILALVNLSAITSGLADLVALLRSDRGAVAAGLVATAVARDDEARKEFDPSALEVGRMLVANVRPSFAELRESYYDGKLQPFEVKARYQDGVAAYLADSPEAEAQVKLMLQRINHEIACRRTVCDKPEFDRRFAEASCRLDRDFRTWINQQRRESRTYLKNFTDYVDGLDCVVWTTKQTAKTQVSQ